MSTAPTLVFSKLYYFFHELIGGTVFVDQDATFVGWSTDVDAESSLGLVAKHFNVTIMLLPGAWLVPENSDDEFDSDFTGDADDAVTEFVDRNVEMILEAIKQAHTDAADVTVEDAEEEEFEETEIVNHVGPVGDAVQQRDEEKKEEKIMSKKKTAAKKMGKAKTSFTKVTPVATSVVKKIAKAKKPAKKAPVKGSKPAKKPAKGGGKKK